MLLSFASVASLFQLITASEVDGGAQTSVKFCLKSTWGFEIPRRKPDFIWKKRCLIAPKSQCCLSAAGKNWFTLQICQSTWRMNHIKASIPNRASTGHCLGEKQNQFGSDHDAQAIGFLSYLMSQWAFWDTSPFAVWLAGLPEKLNLSLRKFHCIDASRVFRKDGTYQAYLAYMWSKMQWCGVTTAPSLNWKLRVYV